LPYISPPKYKENDENCPQMNLITNSPLFRNNITISVKKENGYTSKWAKSKKMEKNHAFVNSAEKNIVGENKNSRNEFLDNQISYTNNFFGKNGHENQKNLKSLEVEINKVLNKLNEISESIKSPTISMK
jgi:hypothetical protein